jgi:hypothetical protein
MVYSGFRCSSGFGWSSDSSAALGRPSDMGFQPPRTSVAKADEINQP